MKDEIRLLFKMGVLSLACVESSLQGQPTNTPPHVAIVWPVMSDCVYNYLNRYETPIKIKAEATDDDGWIAEVRFYAGTNLIGTVTNPPFNVIWQMQPFGTELKAVAVDNFGDLSESAPVWVGAWYGAPAVSVLGIVSPENGSLFAAPATFEFSAELLASPGGGREPVDFLVGTNSVGTLTQSGPFTATMPLYSLTVTNLPEGDYVLRANAYANPSCPGPRIRVTKLGMKLPRLTGEGHFAFDVVTSFPTNQNIIEASSKLFNWTAISTNVPMTNSFTFTEPSLATNSPRFYRAVVPAQ